MSTDSTELTFVRCPSCRSLVPAISTRCRMCGATLEASAVPETGDQDQRKSGRVRQRTMSESTSDLASTAQQMREDTPPPPPPPEPPAAQKVAPPPPPVTPIVAAPPVKEELADDIEDPLSAYIEEVEMKEDAAVEELEEEEEEEKPAPIQLKRETPPAPPPSFDDDDSDETDATDLLGALDDEPIEEPAPVKPAPAARPPQPIEPASAPRVVVESGPRKPGGKSQLGFGGAPREQSAPSQHQAPPPPKAEERPKAQAPQGVSARPEGREEKPRSENRPAQQPHQQPRKEAQPPPSQPNRQQNQGQQNQPRQQQNQQPRREAQQPQPQQHQQQNRNRPQEPKPETREPQREAREAREDRPAPQPSRAPAAAPFTPSAARAEAAVGRLFGWLVNYSDPNGSAVEVREGKFFVSSKSVKPTDLVIDDKTISSPHALLTVSPGAGLTVQDLMSERGVFVRRKGSDTYKREEETISLTHGDWVRFGDIEFLVSLIAHPGEA